MHGVSSRLYLLILRKEESRVLELISVSGSSRQPSHSQDSHDDSTRS
jgi:hypothetical protein